MNFFERQEQAKQKTFRLVSLYLLAVFLTFVAIHSLIAVVYQGFLLDDHRKKVSHSGYGASSYETSANGFESSPADELGYGPKGGSTMSGASAEPDYWTAWLAPNLILIDFFAVLVIIGGGTLFKISQLKDSGGDGVAVSLGGTRIQSAQASLKEKRLLNIVEEMAIASGIHVPNVYVLREESGINAFAAGFTPSTSVVAVTQGALDYLNRDELQGVIGHEFSHILNQDTNLNLKLIGVLFGLEMIAMIGLILMRTTPRVIIVSDNRDKNGGALAVILAIMALGFGFLIIGLVGQFFANLIRAAISRQREFLADASAVQFTRNPSGIAGALKKIGCPTIGSQIANDKSVEASHLFFGNVFSPGLLSHLFDSHPNLAVRIQRIDPTFNGNFPSTIKRLDDFESSPETEKKKKNPAVEVLNKLPFGKSLSQSGINLSVMAPTALAASILDGVGQISGQKLTVAEELLEKIPEEIAETVREPEGATAAILALLLDTDPKIRQGEITLLEKSVDASVMDRIRAVEKGLAGHSESIKIPIVQIAFPALRTLSKERYQTFRKILDDLMKFDGRIDILEFTISGLLLRDLDQHFGLAGPIPIRYQQITPLLKPFYLTVSFLAYAGNKKQEECEKAFNAATAFFYLEKAILPREQCSPAAFAQALSALTQANYILRHKILTALYCCVSADGIITAREGELIRAVTAYFQCPMPTWGSDVN